MAEEIELQQQTHYNDACEDTENVLIEARSRLSPDLEWVSSTMPHGSSSVPHAPGVSFDLPNGAKDCQDGIAGGCDMTSFQTFSQDFMRDMPSRSNADLRTSVTHNISAPTTIKSNKYRPISRSVSSSGVPPVDWREREEAIILEMQENLQLMEDHPQANQLRIDALRTLPESLTMRRSVKTRLTNEAKNRTRRLSSWKRFTYGLSFYFKKFIHQMVRLFDGLELWRDSMKTIEGHFGSGVGSYFRFNRFLFILNLILLIIITSFVVVPQSIYWANKNSSNSSMNRDSLYNSTNEYEFGSIITGNGYLENTLLFYGFYSDQVVESAPNVYYSMPLAYLFTTFACLLLAVICLGVSASREYRDSVIQTSAAGPRLFCNKIFCGWDFSIANQESAYLKHKSICNDLKETLEPFKEGPTTLDWGPFLTNLFIQVGIHASIIGLMVGTGILMWYILHSNLTMDNTPGFMAEISLSLVVTLIVLFVPMVFSWIVQWEGYQNYRTEIYVTLARTFFLEAVIVSVLVFFWLDRANSGECWETYLGQEIYRLVMLDFVVTVMFTFVAEFTRKKLYSTPFQYFGPPEFDIARNTLNLIYNQSLFWIGLFFSPLLSAVLVIKLFVTFYVRKISLLYNCRFSTRPWRAAQAKTVFLSLSLIALIATIGVVGYTVSSVSVSSVCGPFMSYNSTYQVISQVITEWSNETDNTDYLLLVITWITKPGVVGLIIVAMCVFVYCMRSLSTARHEMVHILRDMLKLEAKDREFLLRTIFNFIRMTDGDGAEMREFTHRKGPAFAPYSVPNVKKSKKSRNSSKKSMHK